MEELWKIIRSWIIYGIEGRKIEIKREFPLETKEYKAKLAKLITAIANSPGGIGYFILGVVDSSDRHGESLDDIITGISHPQDVYQRQIQQALSEYTNPIPVVTYREISVPELPKKVGIIIIERSQNKPHEITRECGSVKPGIYIKRGAETFLANREEILSMTGGNRQALIVNFTHPITSEQVTQIQEATGFSISEIVQPPIVPIHFQESSSFEEQVVKTVDTVGLTREEWQELDILVNVPGFATIASPLIAELHGRMGHFPKILRFKRSQDNANRYEFAEIIQLQRIRDAARARR